MQWISLQERLKVTSVVVTHELELCFSISDRVAFLNDGRIAAVGRADEIRRSDHPDLRAFLAGVHEPARELSGRAAAEKGGIDGP